MIPGPSPQVFAIFAMLLEERVGIKYALEDATLIGDKLTHCATEAGFESLLDYYYYLRYDSGSQGDFDQLVEALVVNETYFFREYEALKVVLEEFLLPAHANGRVSRVWSAACSTGEEPLTLAMMLAARGALDRVDILATDLSERALNSARKGTFGPRALRATSRPREAESWVELVDGRPRVKASLLEHVRFARLNLLDDARIRELGAFEVILCRNVLIYFSEQTIRRIVTSLTEALVPNGVLLLGASESLLRFGGTLVCEERRGTFFYRKPP